MLKGTSKIGRIGEGKRKFKDPKFLKYIFSGDPSKLNGIWTISPMVVDSGSLTSGQVLRISTGLPAFEIMRRSTVKEITWSITAEIFNPSTFTRINDLGIRIQLANAKDGVTQNTTAVTEEANLTETQALNTVSASGVISKATIDGFNNEFMKVVSAGADNALSSSDNRNVSGEVLIELV